MKTSRSYLIATLRGVGDALLASSIAASIKAVMPGARVDLLTFDDCAGVLQGHPCIDKVISVKRNSKMPPLHLFRKYDVAVATDPSDRITLAARLAGKRMVGFDHPGKSGSWWKRLVASHCVSYKQDSHVLPHFLSLLQPLGIPGRAELVIKRDDVAAEAVAPAGPYAVMHPFSRKKAKYWPARNWARLAALVAAQGIVPLFTRTGEAVDELVLQEILAECPAAVALDAPLSWQALASLIDKAERYYGVDTALSHVAATSDTPSTIIFGPTVARRWAPWPGGSDADPFAGKGAVLSKGTVTVVRKEWDCLHCDLETCLGGQKIQCLHALSAEEALQAEALGKKQNKRKGALYQARRKTPPFRAGI